jgi:cation:H+ antiporter
MLLLLAAMLAVILLASELFTNALEHLGERLGISEGVTGSIFAAVGTAMPETFVPLMALVAGTPDMAVNEEIGVGAILGAPLMLSTLSTFLLGLGALSRRGPAGRLLPEPVGLARDLDFFLAAFAIAALAMWVPHERLWVRQVLAAVLCVGYGLYLYRTLAASGKLVEDGHATEAPERMLLTRLGLPLHGATIGLQLLLGVGLLVLGSKGFIQGVEGVASRLGISALLLSLLIIPIATELPEKVNSILWVRRGKDTLALGNITGAMVFQGTLLPAIGILLTPWQPRPEVLGGVIVTLCGAAWLRVSARTKGLPIWTLGVNGLFYAAYLIYTL